MGAAADDLKVDAEEREMLERHRARKAAQDSERQEQQKSRADAGAAVHRASQVLLGREKPTRESLDEYRKRKGM